MTRRNRRQRVLLRLVKRHARPVPLCDRRVRGSFRETVFGGGKIPTPNVYSLADAIVTFRGLQIYPGNELTVTMEPEPKTEEK